MNESRECKNNLRPEYEEIAKKDRIWGPAGSTPEQVRAAISDVGERMTGIFGDADYAEGKQQCTKGFEGRARSSGTSVLQFTHALCGVRGFHVVHGKGC